MAVDDNVGGDSSRDDDRRDNSGDDDLDQGVTPDDEWGEPEDSRLIVRPYAWTRGRTRPVQDLALETLVSTSEPGRDADRLTSIEQRAIVELCDEVRSVAEVAALMALPLGIARVLLADAIDLGVIRAHDGPSAAGSQPDLALMERVLAGLHQL